MKKSRCKAHLYIRTTGKDGSYIFKCTRCPHYAIEKFVDGNSAICNFCPNEFIMNKKSHQVKPHCGCRSLVSINKSLPVKNNSKTKQVKDAALDELIRKL